MLSKNVLTCFLSTVVTLSACGKKDHTSPEFFHQEPERENRFTLSNQINNTIHQQINADLQWLTDLPLPAKFSDGEGGWLDLGKLMGIDDVSSLTLVDWLSTRMRYISAVNEPVVVQPVFLPKNGDGPCALDMIDLDYPTTANVLASNLGAWIYSIAQKASPQVDPDFILTLRYRHNDLWIPVTGPRAGISKLGPAFIDQPSQLSITGSSVWRLSTLFHEARHSDGNSLSDSLAFPHSKCPVDHPLAGMVVCDKGINGPYTIDNMITKHLISICDDNKLCNPYDQTLFDTMVAHSYLHAIPAGNSYLLLDPSPEPNMPYLASQEVDLCP